MHLLKRYFEIPAQERASADELISTIFSAMKNHAMNLLFLTI